MAKLLVAEPAGTPLGSRQPEIVVIGASAGGPDAIEIVLSELPYNFPVPVVVCQHMPEGFTRVWAERLDAVCSLAVSEARSGQALMPRSVLIAPIGTQLRFHRHGSGAAVVLSPDAEGSLHVPSIDVMFSSAAVTFGSRTLAVLLTGLGSDGAQGMLAVRRAGGHTIVQSRESSVAYSMPGAAVALGAAHEEADIAEIGALIRKQAEGST